MSNLNEQQFAKYSAVEVPHPVHEYEYKPLPASMERHAPGEYQPTLPGMEHMLKGEQTHTSVFFKHPNAVDPETWEVPGSNWAGAVGRPAPRHRMVDTKDLHPTQDWVDDHAVNLPDHNRHRPHGVRPLVEEVGDKEVVHDGHHRVVRSILAGKPRIPVARWSEQ